VPKKLSKLDVDIAEALGAAEVEFETALGGEVGEADFALVEGVVLQHGEGGLGGAFLDPVPVLGDAVGEFGDGGDAETAPVLEGEVAPASADVWALGGDDGKGIDEGAEAELVGREGIGDDGAFHPGDGGPGGPGEIILKKEGDPAVEGAAAEEGVGTAEEAVGVDGDGEGEFLGGEFFPGEGVGEDGGDDVFGAGAVGLLAEVEVEVAAEAADGEVLGGVVEIGRGDGEGGGELELAEVAEDEVFAGGGEADGELDDGLAVEGEGEAAVGDLECGDVEGLGPGGGGDGLVGGIDAAGEGEEVVAEVDGGAGKAEEFEAVAGEAVPGEGDVDLAEGEDGGEGVVGGVEDEVFGGGGLELVGGVAGGAGAEADLGEEERGGVAEAEGGDGEAGAEVIDDEGGAGDEEFFDGEPSYAPSPLRGGAMEGFRRGSGFRRREAAEPAAGFVEADLGDPAEEDFGGEAEGEGLDAEGVAVADVADFEEGEVEPAGGGDGGGAAGEEEDGAKGQGRSENPDEDGQRGSEEDEAGARHEIKIKIKIRIRKFRI